MPVGWRRSWQSTQGAEHTLQRGVLLSAQSGVLSPAHLGLPEPSDGVAEGAPSAARPAARTAQTLRAAEEAAILQALAQFPHDRRAAARSLGLSRSAFYRRLAQYELSARK